MGLSVSRIGNKVQWQAMKKMTSMLQLEFVRYKELERLTRIKAGVSGEVEKRLKRGKILEEVLKQDANAPVLMEEQVLALFALQAGFFLDVEPSLVKGRFEALMKQIRAQRPDLITELVEGKKMTDHLKEGLNEQLAKFNGSAV
jgi:F-type H+-transporting ATPase subunit alpha